ncbi:hypothetical protein EVAR_25291_1 [Eumeta japonica]|uniref:Uncharacterized protein n=1 Tax=Eumeta variegata TaxID=151549 RepID=A0A4C1VQH0_EUMVA|nr:hypothetical protein EVAR_25291_1 [Eumeta japonica]
MAYAGVSVGRPEVIASDRCGGARRGRDGRSQFVLRPPGPASANNVLLYPLLELLPANKPAAARYGARARRTLCRLINSGAVTRRLKKKSLLLRSNIPSSRARAARPRLRTRRGAGRNSVAVVNLGRGRDRRGGRGGGRVPAPRADVLLDVLA